MNLSVHLTNQSLFKFVLLRKCDDDQLSNAFLKIYCLKKLSSRVSYCSIFIIKVKFLLRKSFLSYDLRFRNYPIVMTFFGWFRVQDYFQQICNHFLHLPA